MVLEMKKPAWLEAFEQAVASGAPGCILTLNIDDYVAYPGDGKAGLPPASLQYWLASYLTRQGYAVGRFTLAGGVEDLSPARSQGRGASPFANIVGNRDPEATLTGLTHHLRNRDPRVALIVGYADHIAPSAQGMNAMLSPLHIMALETFHAWSLDDRIRSTDNLVILLSPEGALNELLTRGSGYKVIPVPLPDAEEREAFTHFLLSRHDQNPAEFAPLSDGITGFQTAQLTGGLRLRDLLECSRAAAAMKQPISRDLIRARKAEAIRQIGQGLVEVHEPDQGFESVAGLHSAKTFLLNLRDRLRSGDQGVPQALLLAGVPGCGKSYLVLATGKELNWPVVVMRGVRDRWVGSTEQRLETVLNLAETLSPCILWLDEVDQAIGQRSTNGSSDGGTSERFFARILEWTGSLRHRGKVLLCGTTNRPDLMDSAVVDRFGVTIPFIHPAPSEVSELMPILAGQVGRTLTDTADPGAFAAAMPMPTVRALQEVVAMAGVFADMEGHAVGLPIGPTHLAQAASAYKPTYDPLMHEFLALTALQMTSFQFLLPWRRLGVDGADPSYGLPPYLNGLVHDGTGDLDAAALAQRRAGLARQLRGGPGI